MKADWDAVLGQSHPQWEGVHAHHYGDPVAEANAVGHADAVSALAHLGAIEVRGADAEALLQGQLTSDLSLLGPERTLLGAWCNPKGRVITTMRIIKHDTAIWLLLPAEYVASTIARMRMYVLRADVQLEDASARVLSLGVGGPRAARRLAEDLGELPLEVDRAACANECVAVRLPGAAPRFAVAAPSDRLRVLWQRLAEVARPVGSNAWRLGDIRAGVPELSGSLAESFLPQMLNLQALGAVSFTKGCYTGQEVVARTQHLGRLKRRLYLAESVGDDAPGPGDPLYLIDADEPNAVGTVVNAAFDAQQRWELLAVIQIDAAEHGTIALGRAPGAPVLTFRAPPYSLDAR